MDKVLGMIGMAKRAGKVVSGEPLCEKAVKNKKARLVILAGDVSDNTRKSVTNACKFHGVKYIEYADMERLGHSIGAEFRAVTAVLDQRFADAILAKYSDE